MSHIYRMGFDADAYRHPFSLGKMRQTYLGASGRGGSSGAQPRARRGERTPEWGVQLLLLPGHGERGALPS